MFDRVRRASLRARKPGVVPLLSLVVLLGTAGLGGIGPSGAATAGPSPSHEVDTIGVVSFNAWHDLTVRAAWRDARDLVGRGGIDVIGWQEMERFDTVLDRLERLGFESQNFGGRAGEDAVSWRSSVFELVAAEKFLMHPGVPGTRYGVPARYVVRVSLRHRSTGRLLTVLNTHVNHKIENVNRPGHPLHTTNLRYARLHFGKLRDLWLEEPDTTDWTVGTADLNVDHLPDRRVRYWGFPTQQLGDVAVPSWSALGARGMPDTYTGLGQHRKIDYVMLARRDRGHDAQFVSHRVLRGLRSDHRPLLARIALYAEDPVDAPVTAAAAP